MSAVNPGVQTKRSTPARYKHPRTAGTFTAGTVLAIALLVSVVGSLVTYFEVGSAFVHVNAVGEAQANLDELFRLQLEEDTGLRGLLASGQRLYLEPYTTAEPEFKQTWERLVEASARAGLQNGDVLITDLRHSHDQWTNQIALPLIARPNAPDAGKQLQFSKALVDRMRSDFAHLLQLYDSESQAATARVQSLLLRASASTAVLILLFGTAAIVADLHRSRTLIELERERVVADTLQRAFLSGWDAVPYLRVGTAYVSSTRDATVGGDLFDIHRIDDHRALVLVSDVSGKGLDAAVGTAQVKYSIRTLVEDYTDPAMILAKFNQAFVHSQRDPSAFVSVFLGVLDNRDWTLRYASAGHAPAFVRRSSAVEQLPVTGPVVGLNDHAAFTSITVALQPGDMIVLSTDGLTEARDSAGVLVDDEGVMRWISSGDRNPELLASELVRRVTRFAGGRINDDLALLIVQAGEAVIPNTPLDARGLAAVAPPAPTQAS